MLFSKAEIAKDTARKVLPVPAGPIAKIIGELISPRYLRYFSCISFFNSKSDILSYYLFGFVFVIFHLHLTL